MLFVICQLLLAKNISLKLTNCILVHIKLFIFHTTSHLFELYANFQQIHSKCLSIANEQLLKWIRCPRVASALAPFHPPPPPPPPKKKNPVRPRDKEPNGLVYSVLYKIGLAIGQSLSKLSRTFLTFTEGNANFFVLTVQKKVHA